MTKSEDKKLFKGFLGSMSDITEVTVNLVEKQLAPVRNLAKLGPKFTEASNKPEFWESIDALSGPDVAKFFITISKLGELGASLAKLNSMKDEEQDAIIAEYRQLGNILKQLQSKLK